MMEYGIYVLNTIEDVYQWRFDTLEQAKTTAKEIAEKHYIEVIVFEIIGTYKPTVLWKPQTEVK